MSTAKQQYRVVGEHEVLDHKPGDVFVPKVGEEQLARLVARGSLEAVSNDKEK